MHLLGLHAFKGAASPRRSSRGHTPGAWRRFRLRGQEVGPAISALDDFDPLPERDVATDVLVGDPRIHAALICGSVSCPTLRGEPYAGAGLNEQLRYFMAAGGCSADRAGRVIRLSRVFLWFGADFVRPHHMPTFLPASRSSVLSALTPWLEPEVGDWIVSTHPRIEFQSYDWGLGCVVR